MFEPKYDIQVRLPSRLWHKANRTIDRIDIDIEHVEVASEFSDYLDSISETKLSGRHWQHHSHPDAL